MSRKPLAQIEEKQVDRKELCPIVEAIKEVGGEWKLIIIRYLAESSSGFNDLVKRIDGLNPKTLSRTLKTLQERGIISRNVVSTQPFKVIYALTPKGEALNNVLKNFREWGEEWIINKPS
ncbi:MAG: helix-turn-helix domain-containing protein [Thermoplasmataceae archaeon]|jgi:DNA-binding HxlR family transcriptional regulator